MALLETGAPADDPAVKKITDAVRDASYSEVRTYQLTLFILYLDRLGDPADRPLIQMLGVRLAAGQNNNGGWTYTCRRARREHLRPACCCDTLTQTPVTRSRYDVAVERTLETFR